MHQPISRRQHVVADYSFVAAAAAAPTAAGFSEDSTASTLSYVLSGTALASSLLTRAEWGLVKAIPFKAHLALDAVSSLTALSAPWVFGFARNSRARNAFLAMGVFGLIATVLSRPEEMPAPR
ncbi:hypothetical protein FY528_04640 [Hymenobacter lutimineralis]|uniref:Uncharacterized protein n=1 Tax=Hymenobacter lutimineralis TaxID=2606448 RepID=A0A5D6VB78_9BACT|nr:MULTISPECIES: hypothetical protein [Hymenobacter]QIX61906.1 hypothetical protein HER32_12220 [Hymenobacter sp. BT18]TYZ12590.1 hypothetical protein FY528_04640 [Hymenobacter lutimineralis]